MEHILGQAVKKDITDNSEKKIPLAVAVSVVTDDNGIMDADSSLTELEELIKTAGAETFCRVIQSRQRPDSATFIGSGKLEELSFICDNNGIELAVFDAELSPSQIANIERALENTRVIDRTMLILDIFAQRAKSREGMLQVEIAELKYTMPRLMGKGKELSRLGGGIGTRGPGETKLEEDRRLVKKRIQKLEEDLVLLQKTRETQKKMSQKNSIPRICLAGYTNAGKSTLINALCDDNIFAENMLFATLDPTTRRTKLPSGTECLITDTVGFINKLPHHLIEAFKTTLDEVVFADLVLIVMDAADPMFFQKYQITKSIILSLFEKNKRTPCNMIYVLNKSDKEESKFNINGFEEEYISISAKNKIGLEKLTQKIESILNSEKKQVILHLPYSMSGKIDSLYKTSTVKRVDYMQDYIEIEAVIDQKEQNSLNKYIIS